MTNTETTNTITGLITVENKLDYSQKPYVEVTSSNHRSKFLIVRHPDGTAFYTIKLDGQGLLNKELEGKFSTIEKAIAHLEDYIKNSKKTKYKQLEEVLERHAPKSRTVSD